MKNKQQTHLLDAKLQRIASLLEHLIAVQMYKGGAGQKQIATGLNMSVGKINGLVKGIRVPKETHD
ncbi:hypothetical protein IPJ70_01200 [Candidatus Campbellbacteria bacterium]|nr:MAG: hypothetical protein IPJ70_01200 [Candidatus Campbellbacteria bacterium]